MSVQRIILAIESRLIREMLNRILLKADHLDVVKQVAADENLPTVIREWDAEWIILTMSADNEPLDWIDSYIREHPFVRIMSVSSDGAWVNMKWLHKCERDIVNPSLRELMDVLEGSPKVELVGTSQEVV
jgi:hypothetical protein